MFFDTVLGCAFILLQRKNKAMDREISGIPKMYLLLFINPYTTYYNHQENNSLQQVSKKHAAFEITCSICESSTLHSPYSHRGVTFSDNDKIFHFRFSVLKTTCSHYKIPLPVFTFLKKYTLEQHYLNYIFNFNSTS